MKTVWKIVVFAMPIILIHCESAVDSIDTYSDIKNIKKVYELVYVDSNKIVKIYSDGTGRTELTDGTSSIPSLLWTPDGAKLIFSELKSNMADIFIMDKDGTNLTNLTNSELPCLGPKISPDGKKIIYYDYQYSGIMLMDIDGSNKRHLVSVDSNYAVTKHGAWAPDSEEIIFVVQWQFYAEIFKINIDGGILTNLTNDEYHKKFPVWPASINRILYTAQYNQPDDIIIMDSDGSNKTNLTQSTSFDKDPVLSPNGNKLLFQSDKSGYENLYLMNLDGSDIIQLTDYITDSDYHPTWSPDAQYIAYSFDSDNDYRTDIIHIMNLESKKVVLTLSGKSTPQWSSQYILK